MASSIDCAGGPSLDLADGNCPPAAASPRPGQPFWGAACGTRRGRRRRRPVGSARRRKCLMVRGPQGRVRPLTVSTGGASIEGNVGVAVRFLSFTPAGLAAAPPVGAARWHFSLWAGLRGAGEPGAIAPRNPVTTRQAGWRCDEMILPHLVWSVPRLPPLLLMAKWPQL